MGDKHQPEVRAVGQIQIEVERELALLLERAGKLIDMLALRPVPK